MTNEQIQPKRKKTTRWDLPAALLKEPAHAQSAHCRKMAHRYMQAKYAVIAVLGLMNLYLWYDALVAKTWPVGSGSFSYLVITLLPWLVATFGLALSFHNRSLYFTRLADHLDSAPDDES